jgi:hypothetical protein
MNNIYRKVTIEVATALCLIVSTFVIILNNKESGYEIKKVPIIIPTKVPISPATPEDILSPFQKPSVLYTITNSKITSKQKRLNG